MLNQHQSGPTYLQVTATLDCMRLRQGFVESIAQHMVVHMLSSKAKYSTSSENCFDDMAGV